MTKAERKGVGEALAYLDSVPVDLPVGVKPAVAMVMVRVKLKELLRLDAAARAREGRKP